ncbi:MAG: hypothetical protein FWC60_10305 [Firmicutes bacterium]|nr:hypothetical protein [Bacillota bacterium]
MSDKQSPHGNGENSGPCGNNNIVDINQYRSWRRGQHLRMKLVEFADNDIFAREIEVAHEIYFAVLDSDLADDKDDFLMERFFEWFIFDYRLGGKSVLEYFSLAGGLAREEKALLEKWKRARCSVYQVKKLAGGAELTLRDLVRGKNIKVRDRQAVSEITPGDLLYIRILSLGEENEFSTGGLILPGCFESYILDRIKVDAEFYWTKKNRRGSWDAYLRERAHILNAMVTKMVTLWSLHDESAQPAEVAAKPEQSMADNFLDYFYDRWVNEPMALLKGKTPLEAYETKSGRKKLQELLSKLQQGDAKSGSPGSPIDLFPLWRKLSSTAASGTGDGRVDSLIRDGLQKMGYQSPQVKRAVELWHQYSSLARPTFRKPGAWAAAVIYALARAQGDDEINRNILAQMFNVSAATISNNYNSIRRTLHLEGK